MRVKIDSSVGRRQYSKRLGMIEPVFGNITVNKGMNKLTLRGKDKVNAQWQMYCLVHNIEKLRNSRLRCKQLARMSLFCHFYFLTKNLADNE